MFEPGGAQGCSFQRPCGLAVGALARFGVATPNIFKYVKRRKLKAVSYQSLRLVERSLSSLKAGSGVNCC